jgi:Plasmid pRiA4b ORF-3-like protein
VARTWLRVRVDLLGGLGGRLGRSPGRVFIVGPAHTFAALADAINAAFARWDLSHLHEFELADGRRIGFVEPEPLEDDELAEDQCVVKVADAVRPGDEFSFVFDFGDRWEHRCRVLAAKADPREEWGPGPLPRQPVAIWGWGWIPDQYGRESADELDLEP